MIPFLRPPYGSVNDDVRRSAAAAGFPTLVLWTVAGVDWSETDPAVVARNALDGGPGSIVLLHAGPAVTVGALPAIIAGFRARGYRFVTVPELLGAPIARNSGGS
jgi:peptidoglycan/xylan/chitin deacetylase (PgdA/CDA1 family)